MSQQDPMSGQQQLQQPVQPTQGAVGGAVPSQQGTAGSQPVGPQPVTGGATTGQLSGAAGQVSGVGGPQVSREELLQAVTTLHRFETVLEIARVRAIESGRPRIARVCGDLIAITEAEKKLVIRQSGFAEPIGEAVKQTIQQGVQQLQQATEIPEVQEALQEAQQSVNAIDRAKSLVQAQEAAVAAGYQPMYGQVGQYASMSPEARTEYRTEVRQTAMRLHNFETLLQLAEVGAFERGRLFAARIAGDLAIIANLEKRLVIRQSPFAEPIGQAVRQTLQDGIQRLQQRAADDPDVQAALSEAHPLLSELQQFESMGAGGTGVQQWGQQYQAGGQPQQQVTPGAGVQPQQQMTPGAGGQPMTQPQGSGQGLQQPTPGPY